MVKGNLKNGLYLCKVDGYMATNFLVLKREKNAWFRYFRYRDSRIPNLEGWIPIDGNAKVLEVVRLVEEM